MSDTVKRKRRDRSPVRVHDDGRLVFWTGGKPGIGRRIFERHDTLAAALDREAELLAAFAARKGVVPKGDTLVSDLVVAFFAGMSEDTPTGTRSQLRTHCNAWVLPTIGDTPCREAGLHTYVEVLDALDHAGLAENTIKGVMSTMQTLATWGLGRGFFGVDVEPFGPERLRTAEKSRIIEAARKRTKRTVARKRAAGGDVDLTLLDGPILHATVPTWDDILEVSADLEQAEGWRMGASVRVEAATGMRQCELLGTTADRVHLEAGTIDVHWQLDRYRHWAELVLPKHGKQRTTIFWAHIEEDLERLCEEARLAQAEGTNPLGLIIPPTTGQRRWADAYGKAWERSRERISWRWKPHWTRHHFISYSLAPESVGGYELELQAVAEYVGHADPAFLQRTYEHATQDHTSRAREVTTRPPRPPAKPRKKAKR